jgi:hypothetical protein
MREKSILIDVIYDNKYPNIITQIDVEFGLIT